MTRRHLTLAGGMLTALAIALPAAQGTKPPIGGTLTPKKADERGWGYAGGLCGVLDGCLEHRAFRELFGQELDGGP